MKRNVVIGLRRSGLPFVTAVALVAVTGGPAQAADPYDGQRSFDISVPGARYDGEITWQYTSYDPPSTSARILDATVRDTRPDDYRAVAYVHFEWVESEWTCSDFGDVQICRWEDGQRNTETKRYVATATPNGDTSPANWSMDIDGGRLENVWVQVCTEQWRTAPDTIIQCSGWK